MNSLRVLIRPLKHSFYVARFLATNAKLTQLQTSKMSKLKTTSLDKISQQSFELFQEHVNTSEVKYLSDIFYKHGFEMRMAGGGVRDLLCCIVPHDIDFATNARPEQMIDMLSAANQQVDSPGYLPIRLITTESGKRHGTVTARIDNKAQYEITTLRIDKQTDGRHAEVEFINDWRIDASRRDLTINSMFIDLNGVLYDYFDGENDLKNRKIRFVGDTESRIREDYLRIFRYFRFHTRFGSSGDHDEATISTMKENLDGIKTLSGERLWSEMKRILSNLNCGGSIQTMFTDLKIGVYMGFTDPDIILNDFFQTLTRLRQFESDANFILKPQTLFCSLIKDVEDLASVAARLKFSNIELNTMAYILKNRSIDQPFDSHRLKTQLALCPQPNQKNQKEFIIQYLYYMGSERDLICEIENWPIPTLPFHGNMVANRVQNKRQISYLLDELKCTWAKNNFNMNETQVEEEVESILERINEKK